jgi:hypothetical protein
MNTHAPKVACQAGGIVHATAHRLHRNEAFLVLSGELGQVLLTELRAMLAPHRPVQLNRGGGDVRTF